MAGGWGGPRLGLEAGAAQWSMIQGEDTRPRVRTLSSAPL